MKKERKKKKPETLNCRQRWRSSTKTHTSNNICSWTKLISLKRMKKTQCNVRAVEAIITSVVVVAISPDQNHLNVYRYVIMCWRSTFTIRADNYCVHSPTIAYNYHYCCTDTHTNTCFIPINGIDGLNKEQQNKYYVRIRCPYHCLMHKYIECTAQTHEIVLVFVFLVIKRIHSYTT